MEISPGRHLPTCRSCLTAGQRGGGLNMGLEAMLSIGQNPEKTSVDGEKKTPLYFEEFFLQISVDFIFTVSLKSYWNH